MRNIRVTVGTPLGQAVATISEGALVGLWLRDAAMVEPNASAEAAGDGDGERAGGGEGEDGVGSERPVPDPTRIRTRVARYFAGDSKAFDGLALAPNGTSFQRKVWTELTRIPTGQTVSYGELAEICGIPKGARAIGAAVGRNPIWIAIPCHRVLAVGGGIGGYAGGITRKLWLLAHEQRMLVGRGTVGYASSWTQRMHAVTQ